MLKKSPFANKTFIRFYEVVQSSNVISSSRNDLNSLTGKELIDVEKLPNLKTNSRTEMKALGMPPAVASVLSPPSVPIFVRPGALLMLQGKENRVMASTQWVQPVKSFFLGGHSSRYTKLISTESFSTLISASLKGIFSTKSRNCAFATVSLDGTQDWAVLKRNALQVFSGSSLRITRVKMPLSISRKLFKQLNLQKRVQVGLRLPLKAGYTFISGRGEIGLVGNGLLYSLEVEDEEEIFVDKDNIVALTVNGPHDLQNCVSQASTNFVSRDVKTSFIQRPSSVKNLRDVLDFSNYILSNASFYLTRFISRLKDLLDGGKGFVKVIGPRVILLQSILRNPWESEDKNYSVHNSNTRPEDYLNEVRFEPGKKPVIESVRSFTRK